MERRRFARLDERIPIHYRIINTGGHKDKKGYSPEIISPTKNISAGGVLFVADESILSGAILEIRIELPDEEKQIKCLAKVLRSEEVKGERGWWNIAVCFMDIDNPDRMSLNKYIAEKKSIRGE